MPYNIKSIQTKLFNLPLNNPLLDSTHGLMRDFQLILTIIEDSHGNYGCLLYTSPSPRDRG